MTVWFFIHSITKRAEAVVLVDSRAMENFMNLTYAKWLRLSIKKMDMPWKLFNVDGMENKSRELQYYVDLQTCIGTHTTSLRFFLLDLGEYKAILKYLWFIAVKSKIDWKQEWIDHTQLPIILKANNAKKAIFVSQNKNIPLTYPPDQYYIESITIYPDKPETSAIDRLPKEYTHHKKIFSEKQSQRLLKHTIWDHAIELLLNTPITLPAWLIPLNFKEREEMHKFVTEHLKGAQFENWKAPMQPASFL